MDLEMQSAWDDSLAKRVYCAYGADLIRTGGGLVHTTPSVIFRAAALFQRYQASIDANFRSRYCAANANAKEKAEEEKEDGLATAEAAASDGSTAVKKVEYVVPEYAGKEFLPSGLVPVIDLHAPLDYCIHHIVDHEDISYLCAACLLIAAKMEDPGVRIRPIVDAFTRLGNRRCGVVVNEFLKPPPERYDDFKSCVVKAEETVLQELGFQTFVEVPYKYVIVFLGLLVRDEAPATAGDDGGRRRPAEELRGHSPEYISWLSSAVRWLNDVPRCCQLILYPASSLAVCAIKHTCPPDVLKVLPENWVSALGVSPELLAEMEAVYQSYLGTVTTSAKDELDAFRRAMPRPAYATRSEKLAAEERKRNVVGEVHVAAEKTEGGRVAEGGGSGNALAVPREKDLTAATPPLAPLPVPLPLPQEKVDVEADEDGGMDLLALRKKRRREEREKKERHNREKEKKPHRRSRSSSRERKRSRSNG